MRSVFRKTIRWLVRHWGFPGNVQWWWAILGLPAVPAVLAGIIAFFRDAPLLILVLIVLASYVMAFAATVFLLPRTASRRHTERQQPERESESEPQERRRVQDAQTRPRPEPLLGATDEPFSLEPVKRRGPPKPNGEFDIYTSIRVTNKGSGQIRGCRGRLVRVQDLVSTPDGSEWQDILHIHPAYLRWSPGDGGGDSADFTTEATLDVAVIESWAEPVYQFLTANESLRSTHQLKYEYAGPILTVEISAQSGDRVEQTFNLDGHLRGLLEAPAEVEPVVKWRQWLS